MSEDPMTPSLSEPDSPRLSFRRFGPALVAYGAAWAAMAVGGAAALASVFAWSHGPIFTGPSNTRYFLGPYVVGWVALLAAGLLFAHLLRRQHPTLPLRASSSPARSAMLSTLWGALLGLAVAAAYNRRDPSDRWPFGAETMTGGSLLEFLLYALVFIPVGALMEELLFRGTLQPRLQSVIGGRAALIVTAVAFALFHFNMTPLIALPLGLVTGWLALRHGTIWPAVWFSLGYGEAQHVGGWAWSTHAVPELALAAMLGLVLAVLHSGGVRMPETRAEIAR